MREATDRTPSGDHPDIDAFVQAFRDNAGSEGFTCLGCADLGACRLGVIELGRTGEFGLRAVVQPPAEHEGGPGIAHGGWTAAIFDEVLAQVLVSSNVLAVTRQLNVTYRKPVPMGRELVLQARVTGRDGDAWHVAGELRLPSTDSVLSTAEGVWIERDLGHFARHRDWLAEQDAKSA
jgi:acyl-coenzyme A thioesterase PaaI-like protein